MFHILGFLFVIIVVILVTDSASSAPFSEQFSDWGNVVVLQVLTRMAEEVINPVEVILSRVINNKMLLRNPTEKQLPLEMISIENTRNFSLKMKENTWILKKLKSNQIFAIPVRMYLPLRLFSFHINLNFQSASRH